MGWLSIWHNDMFFTDSPGKYQKFDMLMSWIWWRLVFVSLNTFHRQLSRAFLGLFVFHLILIATLAPYRGILNQSNATLAMLAFSIFICFGFPGCKWPIDHGVGVDNLFFNSCLRNARLVLQVHFPFYDMAVKITR